MPKIRIRWLFLFWLLFSPAVSFCQSSDFLEMTLPDKKTSIPNAIKFSVAQTEVTIGGWAQTEKNWFLDSPTPHDQPFLRRARLYLFTQTRDFLSFMFMVQGDRDRGNYHYIYADTLKPEYFKIRIGLFKKPFSLESLYSSRYLWMVNRSLGSINYQHLLDIGIAAHGILLDEQIEYGFGIFNGNQRNLKNNPHKEFSSRIVWIPFAKQKENIFYKLRIGTSFLACGKRFNLSNTSFSTGSGTSFLSWNGISTKAKTQKILWGGDIEWLKGPMALRGEFLLVNWGKVSDGTISRSFSGYSWYVEGGYILTGENQVHDNPLFPAKNFHICCGGGAVELVGRYEAFQADQKVVKSQLATGTTYVSGFTLGVNYYLNPFVLTRCDWQKNYFHKKITVKNRTTRDESVLTLRLQGEF